MKRNKVVLKKGAHKKAAIQKEAKTVIRSAAKTVHAPIKQKEEAIPLPKHTKLITAEGWRRKQRKSSK